MISLLAHVVPDNGQATQGSPLYDVLPTHGFGVLLVLVLPVTAWWVRRRAGRTGRWEGRLLDRYRGLPPTHRLLFWLLTVSAVVHLGLVPTHDHDALPVLYLADALLLGWSARRLVGGRTQLGGGPGPFAARKLTIAVLVASIVGYWISGLAGNVPDQAGMATKLVELTALGLAITPVQAGRIRRLVSSTTTVAMVAMTGLFAWGGAFVAAGTGDHHVGGVPVPGTLLPPGEDRPPTAEEQRAADELYEAVRLSIAKYADLEAAAGAGYQVTNIVGLDHHAGNPAFGRDGRVLDPKRPESLVYAQTPNGPVLLGAVFEMPAAGEPGPSVGGPLTVWHGHENVCLTPAPPFLTGLLSPFGSCPVGSINVPVTGEMMHVWILPGAPEPFGELSEEFRRTYLADI